MGLIVLCGCVVSMCVCVQCEGVVSALCECVTGERVSDVWACGEGECVLAA